MTERADAQQLPRLTTINRPKRPPTPPPTSPRQVPTTCHGIPHEELQPVEAWGDDTAYYSTLTHLARLFVDSFKQYLEVGGRVLSGRARGDGGAETPLVVPALERSARSQPPTTNHPPNP